MSQKPTSANYSISSSAAAISEVGKLRLRALASAFLHVSPPDK
jgi:hypothetical protein